MFHFSRPQFHSLQGAGFPGLSERSRARTGLGWTSEAGKEGWGDSRAGGSPVIPTLVPHQGPPRPQTEQLFSVCPGLASAGGADRRKQEEAQQLQRLSKPWRQRAAQGDGSTEALPAKAW